MTQYETKIVQYLDEAHASELALVRTLQSQIAMAPAGRLRGALERHLGETRSHAERVQARVRSFPTATDPVRAWLGVTEAVAGQVIALSKTPVDLLRGGSVAEKVLKNAKDDCAAEALEIATYTAIEHLARQAGDEETAELASSILADERRMLDELLELIPTLTEHVADAEIERGRAADVAVAVRDATQPGKPRTGSRRGASAAKTGSGS
jgi:ferritin-like metal-binding protein YciE